MKSASSSPPALRCRFQSLLVVALLAHTRIAAAQDPPSAEAVAAPPDPVALTEPVPVIRVPQGLYPMTWKGGRAKAARTRSPLSSRTQAGVPPPEVGVAADNRVSPSTPARSAPEQPQALGSGSMSSRADAQRAPVSPAAPEQDKPGSGWRTAGILAACGGGIALLAGWTRVGALNELSHAADAQCDGKICPESARAAFDEAKSMATLTNTLLIGGGVLAAAGIGMLVWAPSARPEATGSTPPRSGVAVLPALNPGRWGVSAVGDF